MLRNIHISSSRFLRLGLFMVLSVFFTSFSIPDFPDAQTNDHEVRIQNVYPNPAISYINFEISGNINSQNVIVIYNFVGKKMAEVYTDKSKITINLTNYFRGIYIYQLKDKTGRVIDTGKFQVNS